MLENYLWSNAFTLIHSNKISCSISLCGLTTDTFCLQSPNDPWVLSEGLLQCSLCSNLMVIKRNQIVIMINGQQNITSFLQHPSVYYTSFVIVLKWHNIVYFIVCSYSKFLWPFRPVTSLWCRSIVMVWHLVNVCLCKFAVLEKGPPALQRKCVLHYVNFVRHTVNTIDFIASNAVLIWLHNWPEVGLCCCCWLNVAPTSFHGCQ